MSIQYHPEYSRIQNQLSTCKHYISTLETMLSVSVYNYKENEVKTMIEKHLADAKDKLAYLNRRLEMFLELHT